MYYSNDYIYCKKIIDLLNQIIMKTKPHLLKQTLIYKEYKVFYTHEEKQIIKASLRKDIDDTFRGFTSIEI
ncbi:hypothetical protein GCM10022397_25520 [Flavivirga jejuensis]